MTIEKILNKSGKAALAAKSEHDLKIDRLTKIVDEIEGLLNVPEKEFWDNLSVQDFKKSLLEIIKTNKTKKKKFSNKHVLNIGIDYAKPAKAPCIPRSELKEWKLKIKDTANTYNQIQQLERTLADKIISLNII